MQSAIVRSKDFFPLKIICPGLDALDLGGNTGMVCYEALMNGTKSACLLELDEENVRVANHHLKGILN